MYACIAMTCDGRGGVTHVIFPDLSFCLFHAQQAISARAPVSLLTKLELHGSSGATDERLQLFSTEHLHSTSAARYLLQFPSLFPQKIFLR